MALTVEDGTAKSDADSYLSVADADTYNTNYTGSTDWSAASTAAKEIALRQATQYLEVHLDGNWRGFKFTSTQALAWPRSSAADNEGYYYDTDEIPQRLKDAVAELAERIVSGDTLLADQTSPGIIKRKSIKAGPVERDIEYMGGLSQVTKYPKIEDLLTPLVAITSMLERG